MQTNMTYAQFEDAAKRAGLLGQFSEWDLNLAKQNPEAGMEILNYKVDYGKAMTDEQRALAQSGAEGVRKRYGYSGGSDGKGFYSVGTPTAGSFTHTSDDVIKAAQNGGVYDQLSPEDMQLIQNSPEHGMGVVSGKMWVANATTDEEKAFGRNMAEQSRMQGGGYTTNPDGSGYYKTIASPNDYVAPQAPKYAGNRVADVDAAAKKVTEYAPFSYDVEKPAFDSKYTGMGEELLSEILNREEFSYNAENDPLYSQYKKQYLREGERASQDAIGAAAAATGGIPSSYAVQAAAQAGNYYAAQLTDKIPELYQLAYNQYLNENQMKHSALDAVRGMEEFDYTKHRDDMSQWNADRNFAYNTYNDEYGRLLDAFDIAAKLEGTDYSRYLDDQNQYNEDRKFGYGQHLDEITHQTNEENKAYERAQAEKAYTDGRGDVDFDKWYMTEQLKASNANAALAEKELEANLKNNAWDQYYGMAELARLSGDVNGYNAAMQKLQELSGLSHTPISGFKSGSSSGGKTSLGSGGPVDGGGDVGGDSVYPTYSHTGDVRIAYPSGYIDNEEDYEELVNRYGEDQLANAGVTKGSAPYKTYEEAVKYMVDNGVPRAEAAISPRSEWEKHKGGYISYEKYLEAVVNEKVNKYK